MQRFLGACLILLASVGAGFAYGAYLEESLKTLEQLRYVFLLCQQELKGGYIPLGELFLCVSKSVPSPFREWLYTLYKQTEDRQEKAFCQIWTNTLRQYGGRLHLNAVCRGQLEYMGRSMGKANGRALERVFFLFSENISREIKGQRENMANKQRLGKCFGVLGGIFLIILLL